MSKIVNFAPKNYFYHFASGLLVPRENETPFVLGDRVFVSDRDCDVADYLSRGTVVQLQCNRYPHLHASSIYPVLVALDDPTFEDEVVVLFKANELDFINPHRAPFRRRTLK